MPAEAQSLSWFANGDITGLGARQSCRLINERIDVTAQATGESKNTIFVGFLRAKFVLSAVAFCLVAACSLNPMKQRCGD